MGQIQIWLRFVVSARLELIAMLLTAVTVESLQAASATSLAQLVEGAKKEGIIKGQWAQNSFGGAQGLTELVAGMNKKYGLNLKSQFTPGPDMQRLMLRLAQEAAAGQPASTDLYMGNSQAIFDAMKANVLKPMEWASDFAAENSLGTGLRPHCP